MTLHDELQRIADRAPVADVPGDTWTRARRARRRDLTLAVAGVAAVLALVASAVAWWPDRTEPPIANTDSLGVPDHLYAVPERMSDRENDGSWTRSEVTDDPTDVGVGAAAWVTGRDLTVVVDADSGDYHLLGLPDLTPGMDDAVVALSPDGRELAYGYAVLGPDSETEPIPSGVRVVDLTTGSVREIPVRGKEGTVMSRIAWSPNGSWLAFTGRQQDVWTESTRRAGADAPILGRIQPGATTATVRSIRNDSVPLSVDDAGAVSFDEDTLGRVDDDLSLVRQDNELRLVTADGSAAYTVGAVDPSIDDTLSVAVDLMDPARPTVARPAPDWPMSDEHRAAVIGLFVVLGVVFLVAVRRLRRRVE